MSAFRKFCSARQIKMVRPAKSYLSRKALSRPSGGPRTPKIKFWASPYPSAVYPPSQQRTRHD